MDAQVIAKILAFVLYLGLMIYIGLRAAKSNNNAKDFFLGGRKVGPWVTALSAEASDSSAWLLMGLPGLCYLGGIKETFWTALGLIVGTYLNWLIVAKPLRKASVEFGDAITIPDYFKKRFNDKSNILAIVASLVIVFFFTIYTASGFVACGKLFRSVFGLDYHVGLIIGLVVILSYTIMGGYKAVCTTDFLQGSLIFVAFVISSIILVCVLGGPAAAIENAKNFNLSAVAGQFGEEMKNKFTANSTYGVMSAVSAFAWCLGYFGMPHIIIRFMGISSSGEVKTARRVGTLWMIISYIGTFIIGTLGTVYLKNGPKNLILTGGLEETVFSETMLQMYPAFIAGIFLCAILAASMSTADSQLLSASSSVAFDIYKGVINKNADEKKVLTISRVSVFVISLIALGLCLLPNNNSIFGLVSYAWAGFGAAFGPIIILSLYWKKCNAKGAVAGIIGGFITVVVWHNIPASVNAIFGVYEILPGFIVCAILAVIVSLATKGDAEIEKKFDEYKSIKD